MVSAEELTEKAMALWQAKDTTWLEKLMHKMRAANEGAKNDVRNIDTCRNYQWWPCLIDVVKPKQIVELGGAMGVGDICMLHSNYQDYKLWSISWPEHGLEFSYLVDKYPNFYPIIGDDRDLENWPKELDLHKTDIWYFDSEHTEDMLRAELTLYTPFVRKGAVVVFDDIHLNDGMQRVWDDIVAGKYGQWDCYDATKPLHWSGYGVCRV